MKEVTRIFERLDRGESRAAEELLPLVYEELRRLAAHKLAGEALAHTLQPTALVHEAWLRLVDQPQPQTWEHRGHFFAAAAEAMRRVLVEHARRRSRLKRGGNWKQLNLDDVQVAVSSDPVTLLTISDALDKLARQHPERAELVKLRYFVGLSLPEAAQALRLSKTTAKRYWAFARAWLYQELTTGVAEGGLPRSPNS